MTWLQVRLKRSRNTGKGLLAHPSPMLHIRYPFSISQAQATTATASHMTGNLSPRVRVRCRTLLLAVTIAGLFCSVTQLSIIAILMWMNWTPSGLGLKLGFLREVFIWVTTFVVVTSSVCIIGVFEEDSILLLGVCKVFSYASIFVELAYVFIYSISAITSTPLHTTSYVLLATAIASG